ncbi:hypothetical protein N1E17_04630 [Lacticaseibacillus paracasei]
MILLLLLLVVFGWLFKGVAKISKVFMPILIGAMLVIGIENWLKEVAKVIFPILYVAGILALIAGTVFGIVFLIRRAPSDKLMLWLCGLPLVTALAITAIPKGDGVYPLLLFLIFMFSGIWIDSILMLSKNRAGQKLAANHWLRVATAGPQLMLIASFVMWAFIKSISFS